MATRARLLLLLLLFPTLLVLTPGCATPRGSFEGGWFVRPIKLQGPAGHFSHTLGYRIGTPGSGWAQASTPPGDFAYYNASLGATLYTNSSCGKKYDDSPLSVLSNHLIMGFENVEQRDQQDGMLAERKSLERISTAELDGVPVVLASTVVKKDVCVFDVILIGRPDGFEQALAEYRGLRDAFEARFER
jgi:hypothetical protein